MLNWLKANGPWLLMLGYILLLPTKALFNVPLVLMGLGGIWLLGWRREALAGLPLKLIGGLLTALWLPMLIAMIDAVDPGKAMENVAPYFLYGLAAVYASWVLRAPRRRERLVTSMMVIITLWCLDALLQYFAGKDLLGYPYNGDRVNGVFWPRETLAHVVAVFAPFYFDRLREWARGRPWVWSLAVVYLAVVVLGNSRSSWVMFLLGMLLYAGFLLRSRVEVRWGRVLPAVLVVTTLLGAATWYNPPTQRYIRTTLGLFSGDFERIDRATAYRASIWEVGAKVFADHWINGVGVRGFREVYMQYAAPDNFWRLRDTPPTHPHLQGMEIATDTGSIGLLGLLLFYVMFVRHAWRYSDRGRADVAVWAIPVLVTVCPLNTHVSFYGAYWSGVSWWLVFLALGAFQGQGDQAPASRAE